MSWIKLDDQFSVDDKVLAAGKDGRELHISALCHCGRNLTDGFIDGRMVRQLAAMFEVYDWQAAVNALIEVGLWEAVDGGYQVNNYLEFNPPRAKVEAQREARAERQARWRTEHRRDDGAFGEDDRDADDDGDVDAAVTRYETRDRPPLPVPVPVPVPHPVPVPDPDPAGERASAPGSDVMPFSDDLSEQEPEPVPRKRGKPRADPRTDHPVIQGIRHVLGRLPARAQYDALIVALGDGPPDEALLKRCYDAWVVKGWNPGNLAWATEWYPHGGPPQMHKQGATTPANGATEHSQEEWAAIAAQLNGGRT